MKAKEVTQKFKRINDDFCDQRHLPPPNSTTPAIPLVHV